MNAAQTHVAIAAPARQTLGPVRRSAPPIDPPYDDDPGHWQHPQHAGGARQPDSAGGWPVSGALALTVPLPLPLSLPRRVAQPTRSPLRLVPELPARDAATGRDITPADQLPPARPRAVQLAHAVLEILSGDRPARHLTRLTTPEVQEQLEAQARPRTHRPWARTLRSLHVASPGPGVAEVTAVVQRGDRHVALAFRLQGLDGRWMITQLALV